MEPTRSLAFSVVTPSSYFKLGLKYTFCATKSDTQGVISMDGLVSDSGTSMDDAGCWPRAWMEDGVTIGDEFRKMVRAG